MTMMLGTSDTGGAGHGHKKRKYIMDIDTVRFQCVFSAFSVRRIR